MSLRTVRSRRDLPSQVNSCEEFGSEPSDATRNSSPTFGQHEVRRNKPSCCSEGVEIILL